MLAQKCPVLCANGRCSESEDRSFEHSRRQLKPSHSSRKRMQGSVARSTIERATDLPTHVEEAINASLDSCLEATNLPCSYKGRTVGKVRDTYDLGDKLVIVTTDRQSAFDRLLASIPFKGQVLNQTSAWWMNQTKQLVPNALISVPDPNVTVMQKCAVFPVEFVVRGFMTGSTDTSLWTHYKQGSRDYCGNKFPDGMQKNERLQKNVITPTTKSADHDVPIGPEDIVKKGLMSRDDWNQVSEAALRLFKFGQKEAESRGLLLVDTKYEFGRAENGQILLIDEIHTPDSSRYWISNTYQERVSQGKEPQNIDKEFLRLWFRDNCDPYKDKVLPKAPPDLVKELSRRYILAYEAITQESFQPTTSSQDPDQRIVENLKSAGVI